MVLTRSSQLALPSFKGSGIITSALTGNNGFSKPNAPSIVGFRAPMTDNNSNNNNNNLSRSAGSFSSNASSAPSSPLLMWENMDMGMGMHEWPPNTVLMESGLIQCQPPIVLPNYQLGHHGESPSIDSSSSNYCCSPPISGLSRIPSLASLNTASSSATSSSSAPALLSDPISPLADVVTQYIVFNEEEEEEDGSRKSAARANCNIYGMQTCWDALLSCEGGPSLPLCNNNGFAAGLAKGPQRGFEHEPHLCSNELEQILSYVNSQENWETSSNSTSHLHAGSVLTRSNDESIQYCGAKLAELKRATDGTSSRKRPACNRLEELLEGVPAGCKAINIGSTSTTPPIPSPTPVAGRVNNNNNNNNKQRRRNGTATDPQSVAARMRRERFSERIRILQGLVPKGERLDTVSMLGQTLEYVRFLQHRVSELYHATATCAPSQSSLTPAQRNKWKDFLEEPLINPC